MAVVQIILEIEDVNITPGELAEHLWQLAHDAGYSVSVSVGEVTE